MKNVDLILVGDMHLRSDQPPCRLDDYQKAQEETVGIISDLQLFHDCPVLAPGDVFDKWNSSHELVAWAIRNLPEQMIMIAGQHDLPQHRLSALGKTPLQVLLDAGAADVLQEGEWYGKGDLAIAGFPWGAELTKCPDKKINSFHLAMAHVTTYKNKLPFPGCTSDSALRLMKKMTGFDLILTGDIHIPFEQEYQGRWLINPGSMMQMTAAQEKFRPRVYLWNCQDREFEIVYLPRVSLSREHIDINKVRDDRVEAFVERLGEEVELGLSFENNLREFMNQEKTSKAVQNIVWEVCE